MSLIYSALVEIDRQVSGDRADGAAVMAVPAGPARRVFVALALVLLIVVLGMAVWWVVHHRSVHVPPPTPAVVAPPQATLPVVDLAPLDPLSEAFVEDTEAPASGSFDRTMEALPPYATANVEQTPAERPKAAVEPHPARPAVTALTATIQDEHVAPPAVPAPLQQTTPPTAIPAEPVARSMAVASEQPPAVVTSDRASPHESADEDAPMIGSDNYIEVGPAPQVVSQDGVAALVAAFSSAMNAGDHATARTALADLEASLPPRSITALRMRAWYAVDSGDDVVARDAYAQLLQRLPDDVNAGVNLALLDMRAGRREAALGRINALYTQHPDVELVRQNWMAMRQQQP